MTLRQSLIAMTTLAVIGDSILIPFYPQFFASRFGMTDPFHAGAFVAAISLVVMLSLPGWARVSRSIDTTHLLIWTQFAAGMFAVLSSVAASMTAFWVASLSMFACKSSYLLIYPYLMRREPTAAHARIIAVLCVVVQVGAIFGATIGGAGMQWLGPRSTLLMIAVSDFSQMIVCVALVRRYAIARRLLHDMAPARTTSSRREQLAALEPVLCIAALMFMFELSADLTRPFFSSYWESIVPASGEALAGTVFAIPAGVTLLAQQFNARTRDRSGRAWIVANLLIGACGFALQGQQTIAWILIGRCLYGWAFLQVIVELDAALFRISPREQYATNYGIASAFQNLGVLIASLASGALAGTYGYASAFYIAAGGWIVTAWLVWSTHSKRFR